MLNIPPQQSQGEAISPHPPVLGAEPTPTAGCLLEAEDAHGQLPRVSCYMVTFSCTTCSIKHIDTLPFLTSTFGTVE